MSSRRVPKRTCREPAPIIRSLPKGFIEAYPPGQLSPIGLIPYPNDRAPSRARLLWYETEAKRTAPHVATLPERCHATCIITPGMVQQSEKVPAVRSWVSGGLKHFRPTPRNSHLGA